MIGNNVDRLVRELQRLEALIGDRDRTIEALERQRHLADVARRGAEAARDIALRVLAAGGGTFRPPEIE